LLWTRGRKKGNGADPERGHSLAITQQDITAATVALNVSTASTTLVPLIADFKLIKSPIITSKLVLKTQAIENNAQPSITGCGDTG
jgi:hypothetical protein